MTLKAVLHSDESGGYWAEVPALPGCMTQGDTLEELEINLREAIEGWLLAGESNGPQKSDPTAQILEMAV